MKRNTIALLCVLVSRVSADQGVPFGSEVIDGENANCACAVLDVNRDGLDDIVCGNFWYEAPGWTRHAVRSVEVIRGRQDDYSNLLLDVDLDGFEDLVSANYRSQSIYWVRNPAASEVPDSGWTRTVVATPGPMETARLADVDADGRPDVLPNGTTFAAWWKLTPGPAASWQRFELPDELAGHGIGFGDINGDGRNDIVGAHGWAEAPEDRCRDRWVFHPDFELGRDASIPILVTDVDSDGDSDLIWGRGHHVGICWMEQSRESGGVRWIRHTIDTDISQLHAPLVADLDGDGRSEVVGGARYLGHDGKDIGEFDPLTIRSWQFDPATRCWRRLNVCVDGRLGTGLDPKVADLDHDGDMDLVCCSRKGLGIIWNLRLGSVPAKSQRCDLIDPLQSDSYDHSSLSVVAEHGHGSTQRPILTPLDAGMRRRHTLQGMELAMGPLPDSAQRCPLDFSIHSEENAGSYIRKRVSYQAEPGDRVPAWLLVPRAISGQAPAMLCLHQTTSIGKNEPAGLGGSPNLHYAHELATRGYVCLVPDYPSFGDYPYDFRSLGSHYQSGSMKAIWNNIRGVDLLQSLEVVDPDHIGCVGHSLGGHNALFTAAFDRRITAVVTSCGFTGFPDYYKGNLAGWTSDRYMPKIRNDYGNDPTKVSFDFPEVLAAIAPRAVLTSSPLHDDNFDNAGVRKVIEAVRPIYRTYGVPDEQLVALYPDCGHDFPKEERDRAWNWLDRQLKDDGQ